MAFFSWISPKVILTLITLTPSKTLLTVTLSIELKIQSTEKSITTRNITKFCKLITVVHSLVLCGGGDYDITIITVV
jgi:hypothetical protein